MRLAGLMLAVFWLSGGGVLAETTGKSTGTDGAAQKPVHAIADKALAIGDAGFAYYAEAPVESAHPGIERVVVVIHGRLRDADHYWVAAKEALAAAGPDVAAKTVMIVPQFLADQDIAAHHGAPTLLHWATVGWEGGAKAHGPRPLSSFEALDALLQALADRHHFPALNQVVVAGHSGGGQVVQRYAELAQPLPALAAAGVPVRYVVANPSTYAWFTPDRPVPNPACTGYDRWKYGMQGLPAYAGAQPAEIEARYVARDVIYLLGTADIDPNHPALDKSCMAETQGPYRYARGLAFIAMLRQRHPALSHRLYPVPGVAHEGPKMLTSACGLAALFDLGTCPSP